MYASMARQTGGLRNAAGDIVMNAVFVRVVKIISRKSSKYTVKVAYPV